MQISITETVDAGVASRIPLSHRHYPFVVMAGLLIVQTITITVILRRPRRRGWHSCSFVNTVPIRQSARACVMKERQWMRRSFFRKCNERACVTWYMALLAREDGRDEEKGKPKCRSTPHCFLLCFFHLPSAASFCNRRRVEQWKEHSSLPYMAILAHCRQRIACHPVFFSSSLLHAHYLVLLLV